MQAMSDISKSNFAPLSPEIFAEKFSRWLTTYAPQGFIAWGGATYWVIGNCKNILTERQDEVGVNVIRLIANTTPSYFWYTKGKSVAQRATDADVIDSENDDPVYHLVYTPWDWLLNRYGDDEMFPLDYEQLETITNNERSSLV